MKHQYFGQVMAPYTTLSHHHCHHITERDVYDARECFSCIVVSLNLGMLVLDHAMQHHLMVLATYHPEL